jgi:hypothetical protein
MESSDDEAEGKRARENSSSGCVPWWARIFMRLALSRVLSAVDGGQRRAFPVSRAPACSG